MTIDIEKNPRICLREGKKMKKKKTLPGEVQTNAFTSFPPFLFFLYSRRALERVRCIVPRERYHIP